MAPIGILTGYAGDWQRGVEWIHPGQGKGFARTPEPLDEGYELARDGGIMPRACGPEG